MQKRVNNMLNFIDEAIEPAIPRTTSLFMRSATPEASDEQAVFEKIMNGNSSGAASVPQAASLTVAADAADIDLYRAIVNDRAVSAVAQSNIATPILTILKPLNNSVVYGPNVSVQGSVRNALSVAVNNKLVTIKADGSFSSTVQLKSFGDYEIGVKAKNKSGGEARRIAHVQYSPQVKDIADQANYKKTIAGLVALGYFSVDTKGNFDPEKNVTRAEWARMLVKAKGLQPEKLSFTDVPANSAYAGSIGAAVKAGYLLPVKDGVFQPRGEVSRARAGMGLVQAEGVDVAQYAGQPSFTDVPVGEAYAKYLSAGRSAGMFKGVSFKPMNSLTRLSAALFLAETTSVKKQLQAMYQ